MMAKYSNIEFAMQNIGYVFSPDMSRRFKRVYVKLSPRRQDVIMRVCVMRLFTGSFPYSSIFKDAPENHSATQTLITSVKRDLSPVVQSKEFPKWKQFVVQKKLSAIYEGGAAFERTKEDRYRTSEIYRKLFAELS